jgi:hypothetical protein
MTAHDDALSERECWELLATVSVGRLALSVRALPVILPVQYYLDGRRSWPCAWGTTRCPSGRWMTRSSRSPLTRSTR